jgi:serine/threonine-protein phosphatase 2A regulatory subunit A
VLGVDTLAQTTIPAISELSQHVKWRIRVVSIDFLYYIIKKSGKDFINEKIIKQIMDYVRDRAFAVRK